jgi:hypothetical protein
VVEPGIFMGIEQAYFGQSWPTHPAPTMYRYSGVQRY